MGHSKKLYQQKVIKIRKKKAEKRADAEITLLSNTILSSKPALRSCKEGVK